MLQHKKMLSLLLFTLLVGFSTTNAQDECTTTLDKWRSVEFEHTDEKIQNLFIHPEKTTNLYVSTSQNLYKTTDCGQSWTNLQIPDSQEVDNVQFYVNSPDTLIVSSNRIYRSYDRGNT